MTAASGSAMPLLEGSAQLFATRFSGASLAERDAPEAVAAALRIIDGSASIAAEMLSWDCVAVPFGSAMIQLAKVRSAKGSGQ